MPSAPLCTRALYMALSSASFGITKSLRLKNQNFVQPELHEEMKGNTWEFSGKEERMGVKNKCALDWRSEDRGGI
ncbi:hypothetical protein CEXT_569541 [Caerostris extrusa]|uniref:Uncharacterized protein n=1 Tax=Caerostris extrusa TaxID=172846 RepID=A0AAV4RDI0_CAEEX|nr:hypothetical protein CEXT_569541 [Caerostris extrusa]